jgi:hypothetical protein
MIASDAGRLTRSAHLDKRHPHAASGEIHGQAKPDRTSPDDQDPGIDPTLHGRDVARRRKDAWVCFSRATGKIVGSGRIAGRAGLRSL